MTVWYYKVKDVKPSIDVVLKKEMTFLLLSVLEFTYHVVSVTQTVGIPVSVQRAVVAVQLAKGVLALQKDCTNLELIACFVEHS